MVDVDSIDSIDLKLNKYNISSPDLLNFKVNFKFVSFSYFSFIKQFISKIENCPIQFINQS
jgi:hypothetical protein